MDLEAKWIKESETRFQQIIEEQLALAFSLRSNVGAIED
jgi:hypothetical protein